MGATISTSLPPRTTTRSTTTFFPPPPPQLVYSPPATTTFKKNRVLTFSSSARWRAFFESSKSSNKLIVVDFTATWCGPCKLIEPVFNDLSSKFTDVDFVRIDVDELMDVSRQYGIQVMPTFLFIKKGQKIDTVVGVKKEELQRKIELHRLDNGSYYQY